jgi:O-antigen ligase
MLRAAKGIVIVSTVVAAFAELYLAEVPPSIFWIAVLGFFGLLAFGVRVRSAALAVVMAAMYLSPAILLALRLNTDFSKDIVWVLPLLGLCLSGGRLLEWSLPSRWQWPLVTWAMLVSIAWPIVFLRETDFAPWIMPLPRVSNTSIGIGPWQVDLNVVYFALAHNAGILFIDALFRWFADRGQTFRRDVLVPLALASAVACAVAFYQGFVDLSFLNSNFWTYMIRASGTLADPNKLGAVAGFWTIGAIILARRLERPWTQVVTIASIAIGVGAAWLCGSRTGLAAVMISVLIAAFETLRSSRLDFRKLAAGAAAVLAGAIALALVLNQASTHTVIQRGTWTYIPFYGDKTIKESVNELLWERYGYGPAAIEMIKEHPVEGVGPGMFHTLSHDYGKLAGHPVPQPDNAQAWWRHNLSELGAIGFIPLLIWCAVFGKEMFSRVQSGDRISIGMLRGVIIGFFVASLFGMPAQSIAIVMTFWVFAFWLVLEKTGRQASRPAGQQVTWSKTVVIATIAILVLHAVATTMNAFGELRPRERAQRFGWYYRYDYHINDSDGYDREPDPGGNPIMRRWTMRQSLAVIPVKGKVLKFVAWVDHPDADTKPVHTQVWADSKLVYEGDLRRTPLFRDIPATPGMSHLILETKIDRTFRPSDSGQSTDRRELGLSIRDWVWE